MPTPGHLLWDDRNTDHIARHGVTPEEVEEVWASRHILVPSHRGRSKVFGQTFSGRLLTVIIDPENGNLYYVVTARGMSASERRQYEKRLRTRRSSGRS